MHEEPGLHFTSEEFTYTSPKVETPPTIGDVPAYIPVLLDQMARDLHCFGLEVELELVTHAQWLKDSGVPSFGACDEKMLTALHLRVGESLGSVVEPQFMEYTTLQIAEQVQDYVTGYLHETWPPCPDHLHPVKPVEDAGYFVWMCPVNGSRVATFGDLCK
jgi:hypothetical protein